VSEKGKRQALSVAEFDRMLEESMGRRRRHGRGTAQAIAARHRLTEADFAEAEQWRAEHGEESEARDLLPAGAQCRD
jgi:hypothetical protein